MPRRIITKPDGSVVVRDNRGRDSTYGPGPWCGTSSGYQNHMCRCDVCKAWKAQSSKAYAQTEKGKLARAKSVQNYQSKKRRERQVHARAAVRTVNSIFYILDRVATGELTAEQAVNDVIKKYG